MGDSFRQLRSSDRQQRRTRYAVWDAVRRKLRFGNRLAGVLSGEKSSHRTMPSKKQRAKKPGSKAAQEKVAEECRSGFVWAKAEDDAEQWVQRQLQKERESASRGGCVPPVVSRDESPAGDRAEKGHDKKTSSGGGGFKQHAVKDMAEVGEDEVHDDPKEMKVHMTAHQSMCGDEINMPQTPVHHKHESKVRSERKIDTFNQYKYGSRDNCYERIAERAWFSHSASGMEYTNGQVTVKRGAANTNK